MAHEQVLEHARLRVRAVEDRDVARGDALVEQPADARRDEARLRLLVLHLDHAHRLALAEVGPEALLEPVRVVRDDGVRGVEDPLRRAVVLLEPDHGGIGEVALEVEDVADVGTAERVDRLVGVADHAEVAVPRRQELRDAVLRVVGVLVLVDQQVREDLLPAVARRRRSARAGRTVRDEQVVEVHRVRLVQPPLVLDRRRRRPSGRRSRSTCSRNSAADDQAVLLGRDARVDAARREPLRVAVELLEARAHEPHLVGLVVDREVRPVAEPIGVAAQDPAAGRVERQHPHAARAPDELLDPLAHLAGRPVREGDREDLVRLHVALGQQVRDPARQHARLAGARARHHEHRPARVHHRLALLRIQSLEERHRGRDLRHRRRVATGPGGSL